MIKLVMCTLALVAAPTAAFADETHEYEVAIDDLDLGSKAGLAAFDTRISEAATAVCKRAYRGDNLGLAHIRKCRSDVVAAAMPQRSRAQAAHRSNAPVLAVTLRVVGQ